MGVISVVYTIEDDAKEQATTQVYIDSANILANALGFASAFATILNNVIMGKIISAFLVFDVDISALTNNTLSAASDVEEIGAFEFATAQGDRVKLNVPGLLEAKVLAGTHELDTADADVAATIAMMETGLAVTGGTIAPTDIGSVDIVDTFFAREQFRNSGKRRKA